MDESNVAYAGFSQRLLAHNIDLLPILILLYGFSYIIPNTNYDWVFYGMIYIGYHTMFELTEWKATPGKKYVKIRVFVEKGDNTFLRIILRNLTKIISLLVFFTGFIWIIFNDRRKGLHDYIAGTVVLFDED